MTASAIKAMKRKGFVASNVRPMDEVGDFDTLAIWLKKWQSNETVRYSEYDTHRLH